MPAPKSKRSLSLLKLNPTVGIFSVVFKSNAVLSAVLKTPCRFAKSLSKTLLLLVWFLAKKL
jgi:hypothetical protein